MSLEHIKINRGASSDARLALEIIGQYISSGFRTAFESHLRADQALAAVSPKLTGGFLYVDIDLEQSTLLAVDRLVGRAIFQVKHEEEIAEQIKTHNALVKLEKIEALERGLGDND